jgi:heterodisulfide reductase subunit C
MTQPALQFHPGQAGPLLQEVTERSGQPLAACYQCRRCAAGCAVGDETGFFTPDRLIRTIVLGDRETALSNELVWKCVSCYTCGTRCPNEIQTARITETLKKMAKERQVAPLKPKVSHFHDAFIASGLRWGRVNEMEFMGSYELKNLLPDLKARRWQPAIDEIKKQMRLATAMLRLKRMHFGFLAARGRKEVKALYRKSKSAKA